MRRSKTVSNIVKRVIREMFNLKRIVDSGLSRGLLAVGLFSYFLLFAAGPLLHNHPVSGAFADRTAGESFAATENDSCGHCGHSHDHHDCPVCNFKMVVAGIALFLILFSPAVLFSLREVVPGEYVSCVDVYGSIFHSRAPPAHSF